MPELFMIEDIFDLIRTEKKEALIRTSPFNITKENRIESEQFTDFTESRNIFPKYMGNHPLDFGTIPKNILIRRFIVIYEIFCESVF